MNAHPWWSKPRPGTDATIVRLAAARPHRIWAAADGHAAPSPRPGRLQGVVALVRRRRRGVILSLCAAWLVVGCGDGGTPTLEVSRAQVEQPRAGASQVAVAISNVGTGDDRLLGVTAVEASAAELHLTEILDGAVVMTSLDEVAVPAGRTVRFQPGDLHLMLIQPSPEVTVGAHVEVELRFARSDPVRVIAEVVEELGPLP